MLAFRLACVLILILCAIGDALHAPSKVSMSSINSFEEPAKQSVAHVEGIFFINLATRDDRRAWMEAQLVQFAPNIRFERKEGVKLSGFAEAISIDEFKPYLLDRPVTNAIKTGIKPNAAFAVSVYLSHISLYHHIMTNISSLNREAYYLVLEDDAMLVPFWEMSLYELISELPDDWQVLRIGMWGNNRSEDEIAPGVFAARQPFWLPNNEFFYGGAHAVVLRRSTLPKFLESFRQIPITDIDSMLTSCCDVVKSYVSGTSLVGVQHELDLNSDNPQHDKPNPNGKTNAVMSLIIDDMNPSHATLRTPAELVLGAVRDSVIKPGRYVEVIPNENMNK
jgi:GR25 family glycosyltransferase involved in LPS biosynthesis